MRDGAVAVTGLSVRGTLFPGLPVIQALREAPGFSRRIVGFSNDPLDPVNYDPDILSACYLIPFPGQGPEQLFARIEHAHSQHPLAAIIPTLDSELPLFMRLEKAAAQDGNRDVLTAAGRVRVAVEAAVA